MHKIYQIKPSPLQLRLLLTCHGLFAAGIFLFFDFSILILFALLAIGLLALLEYRNLVSRGLIRLQLDIDSKSIEYEQDDQPYFFYKYKVHQTRWFAILKLIDADKTTTLVLNPDCFTSQDIYRQLRYQLRQMEHVDVA